MTQAQILHEFSQLSLAQQIELLQSAFEIVSAQVRLAPHANEQSQA